MNDDFSFSRWAVLFPVLSLAAFVGATIMIFTTPADGAASPNERRLLYTMVAFLGLSALIQGNALFQVERRLRKLRSVSESDQDEDTDRLGNLAVRGGAPVQIEDLDDSEDLEDEADELEASDEDDESEKGES